MVANQLCNPKDNVYNINEMANNENTNEKTESLEENSKQDGQVEDTVKTTEFVKDVFLGSDNDNYKQQEEGVTTSEYQPQDDSRSLVMYLKSWAKWLSGILLIILSIYVLFNFVFKTYVVDGLSMYPAFDDKNRVVLWVTDKTLAKVFFQDYVPSRGDIVVVHNPLNQETDLIKRVIALPGEHVVLKDGAFTVYNSEFPDGLDPDTTHRGVVRSTFGEVDIIVPEGHIFLVGDNREKNGSFDSRNGLGTVPLDNIQGRVFLRFLPIFDFKIF